MNNQIVSMIFSAALILLYVTISTTPLTSRTGLELTDSSTEMVAYLNLCFRALDELGQSFENAKRTRDFLVSLQRRWQARMRRSGAMKRQMSSHRLPQSTGVSKLSGPDPDPSAIRKKSRVAAPGVRNYVHAHAHTHKPSTSFPLSTTPQPPTNGFSADLKSIEGQSHDLIPTHGNIESWIRDSDLGLLPDNTIGDPTASAFRMNGANPNSEVNDLALPSLEDIEPWWDSSDGKAAFVSSL
jgi:hypothetical protein